MSISRYFVPITATKTTVDGSTNDGDRFPSEGRRHNEDVVVLLDEDDNVKTDCKVIVNTADTVTRGSIVLEEIVATSENLVKPNVPISYSSENRFAQWARPTLVSATDVTNASGSSPKRPQATSSDRIIEKLHSDQAISSNKKQKVGKDDLKKSATSKSKSFIPMTEMSEAEQQKEIEKWHTLVSLFQQTTLADEDEETRMERRRFHLLVATLLHARCQEPCVRKAISQLHMALGAITVSSLAQCTVETIQPHITNLQYHNTKAKYIIAASCYLVEHCPQGRVPRDVASLLKVPGIGPLFADLHAFVNTQSLHLQYLLKQKERNGLAKSTASADKEPASENSSR
jgi:hypothetical protein